MMLSAVGEWELVVVVIIKIILIQFKGEGIDIRSSSVAVVPVNFKSFIPFEV